MIKIRSIPLAIAIVVAIFGSIGLASALGYWRTTASKEPARIAEGEFAGAYDPADIRGSYTWRQVAEAFAIPLEDIMASYGAENPDIRVSSLEEIFLGKLPEGAEIGTGSVRYFVALYAGLPLEAEEGTLIPAAAIPILKARGKASPERLEEAEALSYDISAILGEEAGEAHAPEAEIPQADEEEAGAEAAASSSGSFTPIAITGKTSFGDLRAAGYDMAAVEGIVGSLGRDGDALRDYCSAQGLEFSAVKAALEALKP